MVYLGPINTYTRVQKTPRFAPVTPIYRAQLASISENAAQSTPFRERRAGIERRQARDQSIIDTREGSDRRKNNRPHIDIVI